MAKREVDDVDAKRLLVGDRKFQGGNDMAGVTRPDTVEDLEPDQGRVGRDTGIDVRLKAHPNRRSARPREFRDRTGHWETTQPRRHS